MKKRENVGNRIILAVWTRLTFVLATFCLSSMAMGQDSVPPAPTPGVNCETPLLPQLSGVLQERIAARNATLDPTKGAFNLQNTDGSVTDLRQALMIELAEPVMIAHKIPLALLMGEIRNNFIVHYKASIQADFTIIKKDLQRLIDARKEARNQFIKDNPGVTPPVTKESDKLSIDNLPTRPLVRVNPEVARIVQLQNIVSDPVKQKLINWDEVRSTAKSDLEDFFLPEFKKLVGHNEPAEMEELLKQTVYFNAIKKIASVKIARAALGSEASDPRKVQHWLDEIQAEGAPNARQIQALLAAIENRILERADENIRGQVDKSIPEAEKNRGKHGIDMIELQIAQYLAEQILQKYQKKMDEIATTIIGIEIDQMKAKMNRVSPDWDAVWVGMRPLLEAYMNELQALIPIPDAQAIAGNPTESQTLALLHDYYEKKSAAIRHRLEMYHQPGGPDAFREILKDERKHDEFLMLLHAVALAQVERPENQASLNRDFLNRGKKNNNGKINLDIENTRLSITPFDREQLPHVEFNPASHSPEISIPNNLITARYRPELGSYEIIPSAGVTAPPPGTIVMRAWHGEGALVSTAASFKYLIDLYKSFGFQTSALNLPNAGALGLPLQSSAEITQLLCHDVDSLIANNPEKGATQGAPLMVLGRSMGSAKIAAVLLARPDLRKEGLWVLMSYSLPNLAELEGEIFAEHKKSGIRAGVQILPESMANAARYSNDLWETILKIDRENPGYFSTYGDEQLWLQGEGDLDTRDDKHGLSSLDHLYLFRDRYARMAHIYPFIDPDADVPFPLYSPDGKLLQDGIAEDDREGMHFLFSNNPKIWDQNYEGIAAILGFVGYKIQNGIASGRELRFYDRIRGLSKLPSDASPIHVLMDRFRLTANLSLQELPSANAREQVVTDDDMTFARNLVAGDADYLYRKVFRDGTRSHRRAVRILRVLNYWEKEQLRIDEARRSATSNPLVAPPPSYVSPPQ